MKPLALIAFILLTNYFSYGQHIEAENIVQDESLKTIKVLPLATDTNSSSYAIFIKDKVAAHYHAFHTESIYVMSGTAEMQLGDSTYQIKKGDFVNIPPNTIHAVKVTSEEWLEVISVQAPQFLGKDRIFIKEE